MELRFLEFLKDRIIFSADEVYPNLFQSSKISRRGDLEKVKALKINTVIDLEGGFDPPMDFLNLYLYWPIHDAPLLPDLEILLMVAKFGMMELRSGKKVLVHCAQGLNRSGLVCGQIMILCGWSGQMVVDTIRKKRVGSLYNLVFYEYLKSCYLRG